MAQVLEETDEVMRYVKNDHLGFFIPYTMGGQRDKKKETKTSTAEQLWVPAVNNAGEWGRWAFVEITDPWNVKGLLIPQEVPST